MRNSTYSTWAFVPPPPQQRPQVWVSALVSLLVLAVLLVFAGMGLRSWVEKRGQIADPKRVETHLIRGIESRIQLREGEEMLSILDTSPLLNASQLAVVTSSRLIYLRPEQAQELELNQLRSFEYGHESLLGQQLVAEPEVGDALEIQLGPMRERASRQLLDVVEQARYRARERKRLADLAASLAQERQRQEQEKAKGGNRAGKPRKRRRR